MDKEDAIKYMLYMKHDVLANSPYDVALDKAIEALKETEKQPKTNGDKIRAMTDEELADWLTDGHDICDLCRFGTCRPEFECEKGVLEWLKQEGDTTND